MLQMPNVSGMQRVDENPALINSASKALPLGNS
jgi:hypothetical protein